MSAANDDKWPLKAPGVGRDKDDPSGRTVFVVFSRELTDNELRFFHEVCQRTAALMPKDLD